MGREDSEKKAVTVRAARMLRNLVIVMNVYAARERVWAGESGWSWSWLEYKLGVFRFFYCASAKVTGG